MKFRAFRTVMLTWFAIWTTGCMPSASISWSPDGTRGIYVVCRANPTSGPFAADGFVIDPAGKVLAELGAVNPSWGLLGLTSVAWVDDSKSMYFATIVDKTGGEPELAKDWSDKTDVAPPHSPENATGDSVLSLWDGFKATPVVRLPDRFIADLKRSPDGRWLAMTTCQTGENRVELFAWNVGRKQLFRVDGDVEPNICFTGPHRLAWVKSSPGHSTARLVETTPETDAEKIQPEVLVDLVPDSTGFLAPTPPGSKSEGILFLTEGKSYPAKPNSAQNSRINASTLYRWDRATGDVSSLAQNIYTMSPSPDCKTLLCLAAEGGENWVELLDLDGTHPRHLTKFDAAKIPAFPAWHGNDHLTMYTGPGVPGDDGREVFELADHPITANGKIGPAVVLSKDWDVKFKPWFENTSDVH